MKVFISWSGDRSRRIAEELKKFLRGVIPGVRPWVSSEDVQPGSLWSPEIIEELNKSNFGILCLTKGNLTAPWVNFEAGALMRILEQPRVLYPFLIDVQTVDPGFPLAIFQYVFSNKAGTLRLVRSIHGALPANLRDRDQLKANFDVWWPELEKILSNIRRKKDPPTGMEELIEQMNLRDSKIDALHTSITDLKEYIALLKASIDQLSIKRLTK